MTIYTRFYATWYDDPDPRTPATAAFFQQLETSLIGTTTATDANTAKLAGITSTVVAYVTAQMTALIGGAPGTLDTFDELAAAIADDANYATTLTTQLATKATKPTLAALITFLAATTTAAARAAIDAAGVANSVQYVYQNVDLTWPNRPTSDPRVLVIWVGQAGSASPAVVSTPSVSGPYNGDLRLKIAA